MRLEIAPKQRDIQYTVRVVFVAGVHRRSWIHKDHGRGRANGGAGLVRRDELYTTKVRYRFVPGLV